MRFTHGLLLWACAETEQSMLIEGQKPLHRNNHRPPHMASALIAQRHLSAGSGHGPWPNGTCGNE